MLGYTLDDDVSYLYSQAGVLHNGVSWLVHNRGFAQCRWCQISWAGYITCYFFRQCYIYIMSILSMLLQVCADHENSLLIKLNPVARTSQVQLVGTSLFLLLLCRTSSFCCCCAGQLDSSLASFPMSRLFSVTQYTYIHTETETEV